MGLASTIKQSIQKMIWPYGSIGKIMTGHLKGYKFVITKNSGWSPILGRYEPECHAIFNSLIKPGQTVFDLGANNGIHSLLFSKLTGKSGEVFAFEPLPDNIEEIKKNCALNDINNIEIVDAAAGGYDGTVAFFLADLNKEGSIIAKQTQSGKKVDVQLLSLKTFISTKKVTPDFIKIDIEGAESDALNGMGNLIDELKPVFFIELHNPEQDKKVGDIFKEKNFTLYKLNGQSAGTDGIPYVDKVTHPDQPYPHPGGIWGTIVAIPR